MSLELTDLNTLLGLVVVAGLVPWLWSGITELASAPRAQLMRTFDCPLGRGIVTAAFYADPPRDVVSCSAFASGSAVGCTKDCLRDYGEATALPSDDLAL